VAHLIESRLREKGIPYRLIPLRERARTVKDVVEHALVDLNPEEICKTIILKNKTRFFAVLMRGSHMIDFSRVKQLFGETRIASEEEVEEVTGHQPGSISPLLLSIPLYVDEEVFTLEKINFGSGNPAYGVEIAVRDLEKAVGFSVVSVSKPPA